MKKLATVAAIGSLLGMSASASAWWGSPGWGKGTNDWFGDMFGDGCGGFNMNMSGGGRGRGRDHSPYRDYYGYGYGSYGYRAPYDYGAPYGGGYPYAAPAAPAPDGRLRSTP